MFGRWFRRSASIDKCVEDCVWTDAAACVQGVHAQVAQALTGRSAVLLRAPETVETA